MVNFGFSAPGAQKGTGKSPTAEENACLVFISREKEFYFIRVRFMESILFFLE